MFTGTGLLFGILVIGICLLFGICYLEFPLTLLLREWIRFSNREHPFGGERGIRTLGTPFEHTHDFQSRPFSQARASLPKKRVCGGERGIRTPGPINGTTDFESAPFSQTRASLLSFCQTIHSLFYSLFKDFRQGMIL